MSDLAHGRAYLDDEMIPDELDHPDTHHGTASEPHAPAPTGLLTVPTEQRNTPPGARHGVPFTALVGGENPVVPLLGRDELRAEAFVTSVDLPVILALSKETAESIANAAGTQFASVPGSVQNAGVVSAPAAGAVIASISVSGPATYEVNWLTGYGGTLAAGDQNNMALTLDGTEVTGAVALIKAASVSPFGQLPVQLPVPIGTHTIAVAAIGAGTGTAQYFASLVAVALNAPGGGLVAPGPPPTGGVLLAGQGVMLRNFDELWAAATTTAVQRVSVFSSITG